MPPKISYESIVKVPVAALVTPPTLHPKLIWLYGVTGSGKTHYIKTRYPDAFYKQPDSNWKGYEGQPVVAIEDFCLTTRKVFQLTFVQWLTNDMISAYVKPYKKKSIRPSTFIVTSYYHPTDFKHLKPFIKTVLSNCEIIHCTYISTVSSPQQELFLDLVDSLDYPLTQPDDGDSQLM